MLPLQTGISDWEAIEVIGMGSWRLADRVSQPIDALVAHVEGMWRHQLPMDLRLYPLAEVRACLGCACLSHAVISNALVRGCRL